jgi:hypothetical protein
MSRYRRQVARGCKQRGAHQPARPAHPLPVLPTPCFLQTIIPYSRVMRFCLLPQTICLSITLLVTGTEWQEAACSAVLANLRSLPTSCLASSLRSLQTISRTLPLAWMAAVVARLVKVAPSTTLKQDCEVCGCEANSRDVESVDGRMWVWVHLQMCIKAPNTVPKLPLTCPGTCLLP